MARQPAHARYRVEDGVSVVDVKLASIERLFDNRDPAPYRERDLDPDLIEYMIAAAEDLAARDTFRIVFWLEQPCAPNEIETAFRAHFDYELERLDRQRRRHRRTGQVALLLAAVLTVALLAIAQVVDKTIGGAVGAGLKEGVVISVWVLMWRPVEVLVYDWLPYRRERGVIKRLLAMPVVVRSGSPPAANGDGARP